MMCADEYSLGISNLNIYELRIPNNRYLIG